MVMNEVGARLKAANKPALSPSQVHTARREYLDGTPAYKLAIQYDTSYNTMLKALRGGGNYGKGEYAEQKGV